MRSILEGINMADSSAFPETQSVGTHEALKSLQGLMGWLQTLTAICTAKQAVQTYTYKHLFMQLPYFVD